MEVQGSPWLIVIALCSAALGVAIVASRDRAPAPLRPMFGSVGWAIILLGLVDALRVGADQWVDGTTAVRFAVAAQFAAAGCGVFGLLSAPATSADRGPTPRRVIDAITIVAVTTYLGWVLVLDHLDSPAGGVMTLAITGTVTGSVLIGCAVIAFDRATTLAGPVRMTALGAALIGGELHAVGWWGPRGLGELIVGFEAALLVGAALVLRATRWSHGMVGDDRRSRVGPGLLVGPLAIAVAVLTGAGRQLLGHGEGGPAFWGLIAVMSLSLVRQAMTLRENRLLNESLQSSVEALRHQAGHDALTGLANRHLALSRLEDLLRSPPPDGRITVMYLDIDRFKTINDSLGHDRGDTLLTEVGARLRSIVRPEDTVARFGGDEFVLITSDHGESGTLVDRIRDEVSRPMSLGGTEVIVTTSIGVSHVESSQAAEVSADGLLRDADLALYEAKRHGRDRSEGFTEELRQAAGRRATMAADLRRARVNDEIEVLYQPVVELATGQVIGAEALVRWNHPIDGVLYPDQWLPVAEETGLINDIGRSILTTSCRRFAALNRIRPGQPLRLAANLSGTEIRSNGLADAVDRSLRESGLPPDLLVLEVSEEIAGDRRTIDTLRQLQTLGVRLSIDDFGTGYSSLGQLRRFPVDEIKIDQSFVAGLGTDAADSSIVRAITDLGSGLSLDVVAEGVTTEAQAEALRQLGCPLAQGWLFGRALPFARFAQALDRIATEQQDSTVEARSVHQA